MALLSRKTLSSESHVSSENDGSSSSPQPGSLIDEIVHAHSNEFSKKVINILLLGQTGVGKSTFINAFVNYLRFSTLEEAESSGNIQCMIPTSFTVTDPETIEEVVVKLGDFAEGGDERFETGMSCTQTCKCYEFPLDESRVRIVDAPGIGDTRGIDYDKSNFEDILAFVGQFHYLHGICILLKPNESRLTATFEFCIKQLLCHLAKTASRNICFVFTNARGTFYKPGDTAPVLRKLLQRVKESPPYAEVPFSKSNIFCLDNEAFRFLVAVKNGIQFDDDERQSFASSWRTSADVCKALVGYVVALDPHPIADTVTVNEARRFILELTQPLAEILENIQANRKVIQEKIDELKCRSSSIRGLSDELYVPEVEVVVVEFGKARTVCASAKCRTVVGGSATLRYHHPQVCHCPCAVPGVQRDIFSNNWLRLCSAMNWRGICKKCGCSFREHMHIYYTTEVIERKIVDKRVQMRIQTEEDAKNVTEEKVEELKERCRKFEDEQLQIEKILAQFAHFLKNNALAPYNDAFENYLAHLIENQKSLTAKGSDNAAIVEGLEGSLNAYRREKATLEDAMKNQTGDQDQVTAQDIVNLKLQLYRLEFSGPRILKLHAAQQRPRQAEHYEDRIVRYGGDVANKVFKWVDEKLNAASVTGQAGTGTGAAKSSLPTPRQDHPPIPSPRCKEQK